jgi:hypothetical protein
MASSPGGVTAKQSLGESFMIKPFSGTAAKTPAQMDTDCNNPQRLKKEKYVLPMAFFM